MTDTKRASLCGPPFLLRRRDSYLPRMRTPTPNCGNVGRDPLSTRRMMMPPMPGLV
jgi:hypothetical protein